ncbi:YslB family protein [Bacillus sp. RO3]|nr:YslB family protein [Bacillus sp. RO3]
MLRDILIPEILGKHTPDILYWGGKQLSRKFPLHSTEELTPFFNEAGWGTLTLLEQRKNEMTFELTGPVIKRRLSMKADSNFKLEAGFIAEQIQLQRKCVAEAAEEVHKRNHSVKVIVRWDEKDKVE